MPYVLANVFACAGAGFAGVAGFCGWLAFDRWNRRRIHRESIKDFANNSDALMPKCGRHVSVNAIVLSIMEEESRKISLGKSKRVCPSVFSKSKFFTNAIKKAGLTAEVTEEGFTEIRAKLALGLGIVFASFGFLLSFGFAIFLLITGAVIGWKLPSHVVANRIQWRTQEMERHLPEMLDVVALGMRSGLSFDISLKLYASHFNTLLAKDMMIALRKWSSGLERRDEALRKVSESFDSPVFARVTETIIRSVRYGSSMVENLDAESAEARLAYKAKREEQIAKAPVKMMVPTGTLILPAMLILVMGPVLLELVGGGF